MSALQVSSIAFQEGGMVPKKYTCDGQDVSPPLAWTKPPDGTKSFALISDDPDAPMGTWVHWVIYAIPAAIQSLPEGVPKEKIVLGGARQGVNDFRKIGYGGPCPPRGTHRYYFKLYALNNVPDLPPGASKNDLVKAMEGHILAEGQLIGKFGR